MTKTSKTIIFFGTEHFSLAILQKLVDNNYHIKVIVTKPDSKKGRGQKLVEPAVKTFAKNHNIEVWQPDKISDINKNIKALGKNVTGILVSFGKIIPLETIRLFNPGIINVHPSLLPLYRGPSPIESVIEKGDQFTGVTIMQLAEKMDAGPIYGQETYQLSGKETQAQLYKQLAKVGSTLLLKLLPNILDETLLPIAQNEAQATYCRMLTKKDSFLDPTQLTAQQAEQKIRAHLTFPKTKIEIKDNLIIVTKTHIETIATSALSVLCNDGKYLTIDELIAPSGRKMSSQDFLNGYIG